MNEGIEADRRAIWSRIGTEQLYPRVKALAEARGLTMSWISEKLGFATVSSFLAPLKGKSQPKVPMLLDLAALLELHSIEELFAPFGTTWAINERRPAPDNGSDAGEPEV